jgi:hypothetical protein
MLLRETDAAMRRDGVVSRHQAVVRVKGDAGLRLPYSRDGVSAYP